MTETGGKFSLKSIEQGTYKLQVSFIGYEAFTTEGILVQEGKETIMETILLKHDAKMLNEVVITDAKPTIEYSSDKITFNVNQSLQAEGSIATDLLKNVPMINVDIDGKATIAGKRSTRIFIDGKPSDYMTGNITE